MNENNKRYISQLMAKNFRYDGRAFDEFRDISVETDIVSTAEGSARVKIGDTEVIAGVKMSVEKPFADTPENGNLMVNVELLPLSSPEYEPGPPGIVAIELARVVDRGIRESKALDVKSLCIESGEKVWTLSVDVCPINDAGNLFDAAGLAALAAVKTAVFPEYDGKNVNYKKKSKDSVKLSKLPVPITVLKIGKTYIVDPLTVEQEVCDARLTVTTLDDGKICSLQKGGDASLSVDDISVMIDMATKSAIMFREHIN